MQPGGTERLFERMSSQTNFPTHRSGGEDNTGWRTENGRFSEEEYSSPTRQQTLSPRKDNPGSGHVEGQQFNSKMAVAIGLVAMASCVNLQLSTNKAGFGNTDDLVCTTYTRRQFLQLKHTYSPDTTKLVHSEVVPLLRHFSDLDYDITQVHTFKDNQLESSEFIISINKQLGPKRLQHNRQQRVIHVIFKTCDGEEIFSFTPDENKEIDVYTFVENLVKEIKKFGNLSLPQQLEIIGTFFKKVIMAIGEKVQQKVQRKLAVIAKEIRQYDAVQVASKMFKMNLLHFKKNLKTCVRDKQEEVTAETTRNCLQEAKTRTRDSDVSNLFDSSRKNHSDTGIQFSDSEISRLQTELSNKRAVHLRSDALKLCSVLLLDCLDTSKCIIISFECLQRHTDQLLHSWLGGHWEWLIVFCDSTVQPTDISNSCLDIISVPPNKCLIILTQCSAQKIEDFVTIDYEFKFEHLTKESQDKVLDKKIEFQGCKVKIGSLLQRHDNVQYAAVVKSFFKSYTKKLVGTRMSFSDSEISRLQTELSDKRAVHLRSDALTLCSILLLDCLDTTKCIFVTFESLQSNKNMLLHAWLGGHWEWLVVSCDSKVQRSNISDIFIEISEIINNDHSTKRVIILTEYSVQEITDFVPMEHEFSFEQLSNKSQEMLLDKKIDFQGRGVTMRSVLLRHDNVEDVLGPELVTDLITEETSVKLGSILQFDEHSYAPRILERQIYLRLDVLKNSDSYPDTFALSGMEKKNLVATVPSYEIVGKFSLHKDSATGNWNESYNKFKKSRFILLDSEDSRSCFIKLCEKHSGRTLHWLELKNECLLWKESRGSIESLIKYVDPERTRGDKRIITEFMKRGSCEVKEESIWKLNERTLLVVAEPGMEKSNITTQAALNTKLADPTSWVLLINLNVHTDELQKIEVKTDNLDSLVEFLCSVAFTESKYTGINRILLKQALQYSGNVTVLMDWFDEISPHADKAAVILSELMKTKVRKVWVTSHPAHRERLEKELSVVAFT